jgi:hypothetical protein
LCIDLAGNERRIKLYELEVPTQLPSITSFANAVEPYRISENPANLKRPESILLMVPDAARLPLVTITSRRYAKAMGANYSLYKVLVSEVETRERAQDVWETALQARLGGFSLSCSYTPINSNSPDLRHLNYPPNQPLSSLPAGTYPSAAGVYSCEGLGIQTCQAVAFTPRYYTYQQPFSLLRICRDGKALIHTEDLDLLAQKFPSHIAAMPWNLVFIVPPEMKDKVSLQPFVGNGDWESGEKIVQCVAVMDFPL